MRIRNGKREYDHDTFKIMLTGITLENFKAFKEPQYIPLRPVTLVFGQNSSGKSSIIHALEFLKHVHITKGNCNPGTVKHAGGNLRLGTWQDLAYDHRSDLIMRIKLHYPQTTLGWEFGLVGTTAKVQKFFIWESGELIAKGENQCSDSDIEWKPSIHSKHPIFSSFRDELFRKLYPKHEDTKFVKKSIRDTYRIAFDSWCSGWRDILPYSLEADTINELFPLSLIPDASICAFNYDPVHLEENDIPF